MAAIRIVLADDHPIVRDGVRLLLERAPELVVVGEAGDGAGALRLVADLLPDVLVLDMALPDLDGVEVARRLRAAGSPVRVLGLSAHDDEAYIGGLLATGAAGYLTKDEARQRIVEAVRGVARGETGWLSRRVAARLHQRTQTTRETHPDRSRSSTTGAPSGGPGQRRDRGGAPPRRADGRQLPQRPVRQAGRAFPDCGSSLGAGTITSLSHATLPATLSPAPRRTTAVRYGYTHTPSRNLLTK